MSVSNDFQPYHRHPSQGTQVYEEVPPDQPLDDAVGRPMVHTSGFKHTTGEAVYTDDIPKYQGIYDNIVYCIGQELQLALVLSTKACANIVYCIGSSVCPCIEYQSLC